MNIKKTKHNFEDERGFIHDIFSYTTVDAGTHISFSAGAVRGNHYHKLTDQYDYILSGKLECYTKDENGKSEMEIVSVGDFITLPRNVQHAYRALEESQMVSFTHGPRQAEEYETDVYRLSDGEKLVI